MKYECYQDYHVLNDYIERSYKEGGDNFVLIDEVQMCPNPCYFRKKTFVVFRKYWYVPGNICLIWRVSDFVRGNARDIY